VRRLFWAHVAAVVLFGSLGAYHFTRESARGSPRAMAWLALAAAFMFLWSAVSISERGAEMEALREEAEDLDLQLSELAAAAGATEGDGKALMAAVREAGRDVLLKRFESPDEIRRFEKGRLEVVHVGEMTIGRASYEPGWRWSQHVAPSAGTKLCPVEHVGLVLQGTATVAFDDGRVIELHPGQLFHVPAVPHDSWVVGDQPYVSLHFLGAAQYAKRG
jgi:quercetin dioxygenase-like cupin family protein